MYRGKRRCPTCGVPSLICRDCFLADKEGRKKLGKLVRCHLWVEQGITSKRDLRERGQVEIEEYERKMAQRGLLKPEDGDPKVPNPDQVTRVQLKNMCRKNMDEATLMETLPGITHIVWRLERLSGNFLGQGWVEFATPDDAARAVARDGKVKVFGRPWRLGATDEEPTYPSRI
jgi:ribosomal protein S14